MSFSSPGGAGAPALKCFTNCQVCVAGELIPQDLYFSPETGLITPNYYYRSEGVEKTDLGGAIVAPGFLDLQTNGMSGIHFTHLGIDDEASDAKKISQIAKKEIQSGVTAFWATVPTVEQKQWQEILPRLRPRETPLGATLLGAHCEGPFLQPSKAGAHNPSNMLLPSQDSPTKLYGARNLSQIVRLITLAPELPAANVLISSIREDYPHIALSLGHSTSDYQTGLSALTLGASSLTHVFNAMSPLHHRDPGLPGLIALSSQGTHPLNPNPPCFFSVIPDAIHLHAAILTLAFRANPSRCMLITDSIELAGLPDGVYPGHSQISHQQRKVGNKVTIEGTDTLIGSCCTLDECVRNMVSLTGCTLAESVRCVTENIAEMMGERKRGALEPGRRADFAILDDHGKVKATWMAGKEVWRNE